VIRYLFKTRRNHVDGNGIIEPYLSLKAFFIWSVQRLSGKPSILASLPGLAIDTGQIGSICPRDGFDVIP
jgi:hypothetical protein